MTIKEMLLSNVHRVWQNRVIRDGATLYGGRSLNMVAGLASMLIYGSVFSKTGIAVISLFEMVVSLFLSFGFTWSAFGIVRFGKEELLVGGSLNHTSSLRLTILLPSLLLSLCALLLFYTPLTSYMGTNDGHLVSYLIVDLLLLVAHEHLTYLLTCAEQHTANAIYCILESIGRLFILLMFYFGVFAVSAEGYIKMGVGMLAGLLLARFLFVRKAYLVPFEAPRRHDVVLFLKFVVPQIYGFVGLYLINWMDVYFIRAYGTMEQLGAYQFLYSIFLKLCSFAIILNTLFFPRIVAWRKEEQDKLHRYLTAMPQLTVLTAFVLCGVFLASYKYVFGVFFGEKYTSAYPAFNVLLLAIPFYFGTYLYIPVLNTYDKVMYIQIVNVVSASSNFLVDALLIKKYGVIAAAAGTFLATFIKLFLLMVKVDGMFSTTRRLFHLIVIVVLLSVMAYAAMTAYGLR